MGKGLCDFLHPFETYYRTNNQKYYGGGNTTPKHFSVLDVALSNDNWKHGKEDNSGS